MDGALSALTEKDLKKLLASKKKKDENLKRKADIVKRCQNDADGSEDTEEERSSVYDLPRKSNQKKVNPTSALDDDERALALSLFGKPLTDRGDNPSTSGNGGKKMMKENNVYDEESDNDGIDIPMSFNKDIGISSSEDDVDLGVSDDESEIMAINPKGKGKGKAKSKGKAKKASGKKRKYLQADMDIELDKEPNTKKLKIKKSERPSAPSSTSSKSMLRLSHFSPVSKRLLGAGNALQRARISSVDPFPDDKEAFTWTTLTQLVQYREKLEDIDEETKAKMINYIWRGTTSQIRNEVKNKAKIMAPSALFLNITDQKESQERMKWLLVKGRYMYGGLVLEAAKPATETTPAKEPVYKIDKQQPYGTGLLSDIIAAQWYHGHNGDGIRFRHLFKSMPLPLIAFVATAIECSISEMNIRASDVRFTEEVFKPRYIHHLKQLQKLEDKSSIWMASFRSNLAKEVMQKALKGVPEDSDEDDLEGVDFEALENSVKM